MARGEVTRSKGRQGGNGALSRTKGSRDEDSTPVEADDAATDSGEVEEENAAASNGDVEEGVSEDDSNPDADSSEATAEDSDAADDSANVGATGNEDEDPGRNGGMARIAPLCPGEQRAGASQLSALGAWRKRPIARASNCPSPPPRPISTRFPPTSSPSIPATARSNAASRASFAGTRWRWSCGRTKSIPASAATFRRIASAATLYEVAFNHFFHGKGDDFSGDQIYFQGHAPPGIYSRAFLEGRLSEDAAEKFPPGAGPRRRAVVVSASLADAPFLGISHGVDGLGADHGHLSGPVQQISARPRHQRHEQLACLVLHRRRRNRRAGIARRHHARLARASRQPDLRHQLQSAAARRPGARQRQNHSGTGRHFPRGGLECAQSDLGRRLGRTAGERQDRACWSSGWAKLSTANIRNTTSCPARISASISSASIPSCSSWSAIFRTKS